ncbi:gamma-glutamyltransferase [Candidatus Halobeggiatoa sp. HSG11]|nr:gamma-glutamyltransferase [Candidatus Halobeggiatoa sp. HSG11]
MPDNIFTPIQAKNGMVVTSEQLASQIGIQVLKNGGNAIDAAVTVGFVMSVTFPQAGNIGGGGFMLVYSADDNKVIAIDYREQAPAKASQDMFLDATGEVDYQLSQFSYLSAGVPGTVAGMAMALEKYGTLSLAEALAPAIKLAETGFILNHSISNSIKQRSDNFSKYPTTKAIFLKPDGNFYEAGELLIQKDLANTLKTIVKQGVKGFYTGEIAKLIANDMHKHGGLITTADLANYQPKLREPMYGTYRNHEIYSMSPPSSGGTHIIQILNILENYNIKEHNTANTIHLMVEAMKLAYADRAKYLGDTDFVTVPLKGLTSKKYAAKLSKLINKLKPNNNIHFGQPSNYESEETTHYSVVDKYGNAVSNTYSLNFSYGSGIVIKGTGMLINNTMDDFSSKPGKPNAYGLIGGIANSIEPRKRMLSSMSPTIVMKNNRPFIITGSPGGSKIITTTLQVILNVIDHNMNIQEAVNSVRIHHQWQPNEIRVEKGLNLDTINLLKSMGHTVVMKHTMGAAASILVDNNLYYGASDPRRNGLALGY